VEANLAVPADGARQRAEAEDSPEVGGVDRLTRRLPQHDLRREIVDSALCVPALMGPMPLKLIIPHNLRMLVIHPLTRCAAHHIGVSHPTLDREPAFRQVLPGVPPRDGRPLDTQLAQTGG
jgi:hypothetical protein